MRRAALLFSLVLGACVGQVSAPSPFPATATPAAPTPSPTASVPSATPTATPRVVKPFDSVRTLPLRDDLTAAVDRDRIVFTDAAGLHVLDVASGQRRQIVAATPPWSIDLGPDGVRGDVVVFTQTRTDGQRTDGRVIRIDLRTNEQTTLDDWSGPYLGGGDTLRPGPPATNGSDVLWIRVTDDDRPFAVQVVLKRGANPPVVLRSGPSPTWADLDESGRVAISTLITSAGNAELVLWRDGRFTSLGTRDSVAAGQVHFVGDRVLWTFGSGSVARIAKVELVSEAGARLPVETGECFWNGVAGAYLVLSCGGDQTTYVLLDPLTGVRGDLLPAVQVHGGRRAAIWREGSQWWLGILGP